MSEWACICQHHNIYTYSKRMLLFSLAYLHLHNRYCRLSSKHFGCIKCHMIVYFLFFLLPSSLLLLLAKKKKKTNVKQTQRIADATQSQSQKKTKKENKSFCFLIKLYHSVDTISQAQANRNCNI